MIDWARVSELRGEVGDEAFDEVTEMFMEEAEEMLSNLGPEGPGAWEKGFHALKSAALNMGFAEVARLCHDAELRARTGAAGPPDAVIVEASFRASKAAFEQGIGT